MQRLKANPFILAAVTVVIIGALVWDWTRPRPRGFDIPDTAVRLPTATPHPPPSTETPLVHVTIDDLLDNPSSYTNSLVEVEGRLYSIPGPLIQSYCDVQRATEIHPLETDPRIDRVPIKVARLPKRSGEEASDHYRVRGWFLQGTCRGWYDDRISTFWYIDPVVTEYIGPRRTAPIPPQRTRTPPA